MLNPRLAGVYAKSLISLSIERDQLEVIFNDAKYLKAVCFASPDFVYILKSPIISHEKKAEIFDAIAKGKISDLSSSFLRLLVSKKREYFLPQILNAVIDQRNKIKKIHKVKLTTAIAIEEEVRTLIVDKIKRQKDWQSIELECLVNEELIGGFILEFDNNLLDKSISRQLREIKKQFE